MTKDLARVIIEIRKELGFPELQYGDLIQSSHLSFLAHQNIVKGKFISYSLEEPSIALVQLSTPFVGIPFCDLSKKHWVRAIENSSNIKLDTLGYYLWLESTYLTLDYEEDIPSDTKL